jgi:hypothetical protein
MRKFTILSMLTSALIALSTTRALAQYTTISIGSGFTSANGVNDTGQVVGTQSNLGNQPELGFQIGTNLPALGAFGGLLPVGITLTQTGVSNVTANGINNVHRIVGNYTDIFGSHGFVDLNEVYTTIDFPGATETVATGINDSGQIVGYYITGSTFNGFQDIGGSLTTLGPPGATFTEIFGINNTGQISGTYSGGDCSGTCGFIYQGGTFTQITAPGAIVTNVYGISNTGVVVGQYTTASFETHGFSDSAGVFTNIDVPNADSGTTIVMGVNSSGELVGNYTETVPGTLGGSMVLGFRKKP